MSFTKGVGVFIIINNKILLLKRIKEPFAGYWEVPAGKVDGSETFEDAVIREVKEETDLLVKPEKEIGINTNEKNKFESHMFTASIVGGALHNNEPNSHTDIQFFPIDKLPEKLGSTTQRGLAMLGYVFPGL